MVMHLTCLSGDPNRPCYLLRYNGTEIMLDCSLDTSQLLHFLPVFDPKSKLKPPDWKTVLKSQFGAGDFTTTELPCDVKESSGRFLLDAQPFIGTPEFECINIETLDAILISNYHAMLALPYLTQKEGFRARVYATDPTIQTARHLMEELVKYLNHGRDSALKLTVLDDEDITDVPDDIKAALRSSYKWSTLYTQEQIESALSHVRPIAYNEKTDIYNTLKIMAISSGFCIGSCNWIVDSDNERVSYVAGSSALTTHPRPMEHTSLKRSDVMIMTNITCCPLNNPDSMIGDFCTAAVSTLKKGGNVLIPCLPCGVTFDMFECLANHMRSCSLQHIPMYFVSDKAEASLAYSNIYAEWLTSSKTANVYMPEPPFHHAELVRTGWLRVYKDLHGAMKDNYKTPCVIFCGHPTLRCGEAAHFMNLFANDPTCTIIFTDPDINYLDALAPYQPVSMKTLYCPIDTRLSFAQANKLIRDLRPTNLVIPDQYTRPPTLHSDRTDLVIEAHHNNLIVHGDLEEIELPVKLSYITMKMNTKMASDIVPMEIKPKVAVSQVAATIHTVDNKYTIQPLAKDVPYLRKRNLVKPILYGNMNVTEFKRRLEENGISDVSIEDSGGGNCIILLNSVDSLIQIDSGSIHIVCDDEQVRIKLRDCVLHTLQKIPAPNL